MGYFMTGPPLVHPWASVDRDGSVAVPSPVRPLAARRRPNYGPKADDDELTRATTRRRRSSPVPL